ncbi:MAG: ATP synthase F1 subunit delta [Patescibacteria group bacterium]
MSPRNIKHYAKALLLLGQEHGIADQLLADLTDVAIKLNSNLDFKKYLVDPQIRFDKKKQALAAVFQDFISPKTYNFLYILIKGKKLMFLDQVLADFRKRSQAEQDIVDAVVISAVPLDVPQEKRIKEVIEHKTGKQTLIKNIIDPGVIGGLRILVGDWIIDSTIIGKLERLKRKITMLK